MDKNSDSRSPADDDLLRTIRDLVTTEAARETTGQAPPGYAMPVDADAANAASAPAPSAPQPETKPLILGAMARVTSEVSAKPTPAVDTERLRGMVADIVREELAIALGETVETRVRQIVRQEVVSLLTKARDDE